jgi:GNAT superfamily N-acetyltransferase
VADAPQRHLGPYRPAATPSRRWARTSPTWKPEPPPSNASGARAPAERREGVNAVDELQLSGARSRGRFDASFGRLLPSPACSLADPRAFPAFVRYGSILERDHADDESWYLVALSVRPEAQRRGLGTQLMEPVLDRADRDGVACRLETSDPQTSPTTTGSVSRSSIRRCGCSLTARPSPACADQSAPD